MQIETTTPGRKPMGERFNRASAVAIALLVITAFALLAADTRSRGLALNTLKLVAGTLAISLPLGTLLGLLIARTNLPLRLPSAAMLGLLLIVPLYLIAAAWQSGFGLFGWYTLIFGGSLQQPWLIGWRGAIFVHGVAATPWVALIVGLAARQVEPQLEEAALLDASAWRVFYHVTLPRIAPALALAALWVSLLAATDMTVTDLYQVRTYAEEVYVDFAAPTDIAAPELGPWAGAAVVTALAAGAIILCMGAAQYSARVLPKQIHQFHLGRWRWPAAAIVVVALVVILGVPLFNLIYKAGVVVQPNSTGVTRTWIAMKAAHIVAESPLRFWKEAGWSLIIATGAASAALLVALPLAWYARRGNIVALPAVLVGAAALAVPAPLLAIGLIHLLNNPELPWLGWMYHSVYAPMLAQAIRALPLTTFLLWFGFRTIAGEQFEAAALDGATGAARFFRIALPQRWQAVGAAWIAAFVLAFNELPATLLLEAPGRMTLPIAVYQLMHGTGEDRLAGIALCMVLGYLLLGAAILILWRMLFHSSHFGAGRSEVIIDK
ncbi:MAG TPA: ABC transporter permease subunit [Pirellulales bacterium]|jgi:iron(III) transport system permease protein